LEPVPKIEEEEFIEELVPPLIASPILRFLVESQNPLDDDDEEFINYRDKFEDDSINLEFG